MALSFTPRSTVPGNGTLTLSVASTGPVAGLPVLANATPAQAGITLAGLPACAGATGAIDPATHELTVTLPSGCVLPANVSVQVQVPSGFFAPNPAPGTSVLLALATSSDPAPLNAPAYTTSVPASPSTSPLAQPCLPLPHHCTSTLVRMGCWAGSWRSGEGRGVFGQEGVWLRTLSACKGQG